MIIVEFDINHCSTQVRRHVQVVAQARTTPRTLAGTRKTAKITDPKRPTQNEIDEHMKVRLLYRNWCCHRVRGRGKAEDHRRQAQSERIIPEFHMDHMFMESAHCDHTDVNEKDRRMHMASVVPRKGGSVDLAAKIVLAFLDEMGSANSPVLFKTDQEPSIVDLVNKLKDSRVGITTLIEKLSCWRLGVQRHPGKALEGLIRVLKDALEGRWCVKLDSNHMIIFWIAE